MKSWLLIRSVAALVAACWIAPLSLHSQEFRGTISGLITDPSNAPVVGAQVVVTEVHTGIKLQTVSNSTGEYTAPFLEPGDYDIDVEQQGFKHFVRNAVHVGAGDHPVIDIALQVGNQVQTVSVTADAPIINSENSTVGQAITEREVENLPLNGRTPLTLASLSIGVIATGQPGLIHPFDLGAAAGWSIAGTPSQVNELLIDGSPDATWDGRLAYSPPADAVEEVRVKAFDNDASFGHTGGGTINQVLKTGTNDLHGTLYEFNQPNTLVANQWFSNKAGQPSPVLHYNQYGLTAGGPMWIPKVFNGRNKLFWFFAWEGLKDSQPNTTFLSVPTAAERQGNFAGLPQLYNPYGATLNSKTGAITRTAIAGNNLNTVPGGLNPVAVALLNSYPLPNIAPQGAFGTLNYLANAPTVDNYSNELGRLDYNMSERNRISFDVRHTDYTQVKNDYFGNGTTASLLTRGNQGGTIDDVFTINPTNLLDVRVNFTRMDETHPSPTAGFDPISVGLPSYLATNSEYLQLPVLSFTNYQSLGSSSSSLLPSQSLQLYSSWVSVRGKHTLKFGLDVRQYNLNVSSYGNSEGDFSFSNAFVRSSSTASSTVAPGQDLASFLLGLPTGGGYDLNASSAWYEHYAAGFVQDDWRVKSNLTINLGIRYDHDGPYYEKYGRTVDGFDATATSPLAAAARSAYASSPIPQLPPSDFDVNGGLTYPRAVNGPAYQTTSHLFSPRGGFAWSPGVLGGKTVISGGFGMFVQPITVAQLATTGKYSTNPILNQQGFSQTTTLVASTNNNLSPAVTLNNPFPNGIQQPVGSALGLGTFLGQSVSFIDPDQKNPYAVRWNFGIQHQLGSNTLLEVVYMGNHGVHLPVAYTQLNGLPSQYLSTLPTRDQNLINTLQASANNPFYALPNTAASTSKTTTVAQLLSTYPQFPNGEGSGSTGVIEDNADIGSSYFQSLNARVQRRFSSGLTLVGNYAFSKLIERDTWLNFPDTRLEKRISPFDHPNRFVLAITYDLPIGKGRLLDIKSRWLDAFVGGWNLNTVYTYQTGAPLLWTAGSTTAPGDYIYNGAPLDFNNRQVNGPAFNLAAFDTNSADQYQYHIRTFSTTFPNLRQDAINEWDVSILKRFLITEKRFFELRGEAYNVVNHPVFGAPGQTSSAGPVVAETNTSFGLITFQDNRPRSLQLGARFVF